MAVPDYQTLMAPALHALTNREVRTTAQLRGAVAEAIRLTDEDWQQTVPSGAPLFNSRLHWAVTYLSQAGLLQRPRRGTVQITDRGMDVLAKHPDRVDNHELSEFKEFNEFRTRTGANTGRHTETAAAHDPATPPERISAAVEEANGVVASQVLSRVQNCDPTFLERLVLTVLTKMGYGGANSSSEHLGRSGDEGLDGVIRQDPLGLDRIYVQAKRYRDRTVGRPEIQAFVGALHGAQADRGVFITTSKFSPDAEVYAERVAARVILIDGLRLADLMVRHNIGVQDQEIYVVKRIDEDFFEDS